MSGVTLPETIPEILAQRSKTTPDQTASYHQDPKTGPWVASTWRELTENIFQVSRAYHDAGLRKGDRLAVLARTSRDWLLTELAGLSIGAVIVGIDPAAPAGSIEWILQHSEAKFLATDTSLTRSKVPDHSLADLSGICVFAEGVDQVTRRTGNMAPAERQTPLPSDPATIVYTSGTTGSPKGVCFTHRQLSAAVRAAMTVWPELQPGDTTLCWLPMAHLFQRMLNLWAIAQGMTSYFVEDPRAIMDTLRTVRPSFLASVPRFYEKLALGIRQAPDPAAAARALTGGNLKFLLTGSAPLAPWIAQTLHEAGLLVLEAYGVTENAIPNTGNRVNAHRFGSVGLPFEGNELRLAEDGEVLVRSVGLFEGYYKEPRLPAELFTPDGFYRTGDIGEIDADGFWYLVGRKADLIKTSTGRRIAPARVEAVYMQSPYVDQMVVFGHGHTHLVALITLKSPADHEQIQQEFDRLGESLAVHERVKAFALLPHPFTVEAEELTPTLKLRRRKIEVRHAALLEQLYQQASLSGPEGYAPVRESG